ncbi:MAG: HAD-IG family 5'-nucleotidase [Spirochaetales bacterium]|nr:HAD-IG family 5'-nucleotidase [Spirochaetales bacterium]
MALFVNRLLNMKKIKVIGFDMDYTLVRYHTDQFEKLTHSLALKQLARHYGYPGEVTSLEFDYRRSMGGLVIDKINGNLLKLNRFGKVKISYNGLEQIGYREQSELYGNLAVDISDPRFTSLDTAFAISQGVMFGQLIQLKKEGLKLPDYPRLAEDIKSAVDDVHKNGSLKSIVTSDFEKYVISDPQTALMLERYKSYGKKLMIITNSDYNYTKKLLDYALSPYLAEHDRWEDLFFRVITLADKPAFFKRRARFLRITDGQGTMVNHEGPLEEGEIYQGGWFGQLQEELGVEGREVLYLGDHIYGDVVSIKKTCGWRTALVLEDLEEEMKSLGETAEIQKEIDLLMGRKKELEREINRIDLLYHEGEKTDKKKLDELFAETDKLNQRISDLLNQNKSHFNPYWGEVLRAGSDESRFAAQMERYACIYMTRVADLYDYSPKTYFRPPRRLMPHEMDL